VRQFQPAVESFTWELPAGLVEHEEDPVEAGRRELLEETGLPALTVTQIGVSAPCTGRMSNRIFSFFVDAGEQIDGFVAEPGLSVKMVDAHELTPLIMAGDLASQLHLGALMLAELNSLLKLRS
jgi:ADP-ribose pyrophosphatase